MKTFFILLTLLTVVQHISVAADAPPAANKDAVVPQLLKGGLVIFFRHTKTNADQSDTDPLHLDNVKAQRQLSEEGRAQAKAIGEALHALKIPVGKVISSKYNRAQEAAKLLGFGDPEALTEVTQGGMLISPNEDERRTKSLKQLLGTAPEEGKNTIIVSHKPNLEEAAGKDFGDVTEGEAVIFQPQGEGKFKLIARVPAATWTEWAK
jgi:phosphohistidine phosphatase SixA